MYNIAIPETIRQMNAIYYLLGLWKIKDGITYGQFFYFTYFVSIVISIFLGACFTNSNDEMIFLTATAFIGVVQLCRMYFIIWKQNEILNLIYETGVHRTNDFEVYTGIENKLKNMMSFAKFLMSMLCFLVVILLFLPIGATENVLIVNVAFPLDYTNDQRAFWIVHAFVTLGFLLSLICTFFTIMVWYLMMNFVIQYEILGNRFKNLGKVETGETKAKLKISIKEQNRLYLQQFIEAIKTNENIYEYRGQN